MSYFSDAYLLFTLDSFAFSVKEQIKSPKKVYAIDTGMAGAVGFSFSENLGHLLENQVYLDLKRRGHELYYYKTGNGLEVDFACCTGGKITQLIQIVHTLGDEGTRNREVRSLIKAMEETGLTSGEIITYEDEEELSIDGKIIRLIPAFKYLLNMAAVGGLLCNWRSYGRIVKKFRFRSSESDISMSLIKSKKRVADHGEVFSPAWMVEAMLDLVKGETERIDSRFLESACGSGNFLVRILQRKLAAVELKYGMSDFEKQYFALLALMCCYGIELLADNVAECRANMLEIFADYLDLDESEDLYRAAFYVLSQNLIHGDALKMRTSDDQAITFAEWGYLGKGKFQRRDFRLDTLSQMSALSEEGSLFAHLGKHEIFKPASTYPPMTVSEIATVAQKECV